MILELHEKLKLKKISSRELTHHYLQRIKNDKTNAYISITEQEALQMAYQADQRIQQGNSAVLTGIPFGIKDILCTKGIRTTCASKILADYKPPYDATAVARLKSEDIVILGKTNMDEFAMGGSSENSAFGPVLLPLNLNYVAGGSSGGSAAAVRAGLAVASLGTDTGGSVRLPAAFNGIVGLKPTYGSVSRYGLIAFGSSLDQIGPMTTNVEDCAIIFSAIAGHDPFDSTCADYPQRDYFDEMKKLKGTKFRIGMPKEYFVSGLQPAGLLSAGLPSAGLPSVGLQPAIAKQIDLLRKKLESAGHSILEISLPHTEYSVAVYYIVAVSEASSNLAKFDGVRFGARISKESDQPLSLTKMYQKTRSLFGAEVKRRIILGTFALSAGYYDAYYKRACQVRRLIKQDFDEAFKKVDLILAPVTHSAAFKLGEKMSNPLQMYLNDIYTIPANLAGLPAISIPIGRNEQNLPIGAQFIGPTFKEAELFTIAKFAEDQFYQEEVDHGF